MDFALGVVVGVVIVIAVIVGLAEIAYRSQYNKDLRR